MLVLVAGGGLTACQSDPARPSEGPLAPGRWATQNGACLTVTETTCTFVVGCGHGEFLTPTVRADGTFDVDGTYRVEAGPVSITPAPPAHFSGSVTDTQLILNVIPSAALPTGSYSMSRTSAGRCSVPCL
jgi:hypothetical protein